LKVGEASADKLNTWLILIIYRKNGVNKMKLITNIEARDKVIAKFEAAKPYKGRQSNGVKKSFKQRGAGHSEQSIRHIIYDSTSSIVCSPALTVTSFSGGVVRYQAATNYYYENGVLVHEELAA
jgi:antitoxin component YwqK of YwqJK toxin-antitoxin module